MPMDYTIIVHVRNQFGNQDLNIGVFAGEEKEFSFDCPDVDASQRAVLIFQGQMVGRQQTLEINASAISGGIPGGDVRGGTDVGGSDHHIHTITGLSLGWSGYVMLVSPNVLWNSNNVMRVASRGETEFVIDNVVLLYKTRSGGLHNLPSTE
jgi:hypothetical protein